MTTVENSNQNSDQKTAFSALTSDLKSKGITMYVDYSDQLHDRQIMWVKSKF